MTEYAVVKRSSFSQATDFDGVSDDRSFMLLTITIRSFRNHTETNADHKFCSEVGDFALLVKAGFSKRAAMGAQFVTATGALLGTLIGIAIQEFGGSGAVEGSMPMNAGLWGTSLTWGDMLLPFTAGTFLYVGTVAVIPELLETGPNKLAEVRKTLTQFAAIAAGAGIMLYISWHD